MATPWYDTQLKNRNYLSPIGFRLGIRKAPKVSYLCQEVSIPTMELGVVELNYRGYAAVPTEGNIKFGDFRVEFLVDENLENYLELHDWMVGLGVPTTQDERDNFMKQMSDTKYPEFANIEEFSDATLSVLNNNNQTNFQVRFYDMFPVALDPMTFDVTAGDNNYFTVGATFRYNFYEFLFPGDEGYTG